MLVLYIAVVIYTTVTAVESEILLPILLLAFGIPAFVIYFVLVYVYFKASRKAFWLTTGGIALAIFLWWFFGLG